MPLPAECRPLPFLPEQNLTKDRLIITGTDKNDIDLFERNYEGHQVAQSCVAQFSLIDFLVRLSGMHVEVGYPKTE